jgi:5-methylcytosine-specific restriction endonuclease McrA
VPWVDDAMLESVLFDGRSTVVSVSRRRTFTGALRRAVQVRDRRCRHRSGCDVPARQCDVDHIVPAALGGVTSQFNGRLLCATHNRHPELREPDLTAPAGRPVTRLDELRVRVRWRNQHYHRDDEPELALAASCG